MKLKCNVCNESPTVTIDREPKHSNDLICCPSCDKQLAYATEKKYSSKLIWKPLDTTFNEMFGGNPVTVIDDIIKSLHQ
jgi:uncharacterized protein YlaI